VHPAGFPTSARGLVRLDRAVAFSADPAWSVRIVVASRALVRCQVHALQLEEPVIVGAHRSDSCRSAADEEDQPRSSITSGSQLLIHPCRPRQIRITPPSTAQLQRLRPDCAAIDGTAPGWRATKVTLPEGDLVPAGQPADEATNGSDLRGADDVSAGPYDPAEARSGAIFAAMLPGMRRFFWRRAAGT